jgi:hypothetical protein
VEQINFAGKVGNLQKFKVTKELHEQRGEKEKKKIEGEIGEFSPLRFPFALALSRSSPFCPCVNMMMMVSMCLCEGYALVLAEVPMIPIYV